MINYFITSFFAVWCQHLDVVNGKSIGSVHLYNPLTVQQSMDMYRLRWPTHVLFQCVAILSMLLIMLVYSIMFEFLAKDCPSNYLR